MTEAPRHRVAASEIFPPLTRAHHNRESAHLYQATIYSKSKGNLASRFDRVDDDQQGKVQRLRVGGRPPGSAIILSSQVMEQPQSATVMD
ncbi:unnamed protein product [Brassica oleracea var. botrytis]